MCHGQDASLFWCVNSAHMYVTWVDARSPCSHRDPQLRTQLRPPWTVPVPPPHEGRPKTGQSLQQPAPADTKPQPPGLAPPLSNKGKRYCFISPFPPGLHRQITDILLYKLTGAWVLPLSRNACTPAAPTTNLSNTSSTRQQIEYLS